MNVTPVTKNIPARIAAIYNNVYCSQDGVQGCKYYQYFYDQIKDYKGAKYADAKNHSS